MKWLRGVIAAAVLMMVAVPMVAQIPSGASDTDNMGFRGTYWGSRGPYKGVVFGTGVPFFSGGPGSYLNTDIICVDAHNYVRSGQTWRANFTQMSDGTGIGTNTRFGMNEASLTNLGGFSVQARYMQAAWLSTQMTQANRYAVHSAIWNLFVDGPTAAGYTQWMTDAQTWWAGGRAGFNAANWYVATDVRTVGVYDNGTYNSTQEYIINVVPEPATIILLGTGLVAVMGMTVVMRQSFG